LSTSTIDMDKLFEWQGARGLMPSFRQNLRSTHATKMGHKKRKNKREKGHWMAYVELMKLEYI
jgi:hypothetical protein